MRFVNIRHITQALELKADRIDDSFIQTVKDALHRYFTENTFLQISGYNFRDDELIFILDQLKNKKYRIFHEWVEQDTALLNYLISSGEIVAPLSSNINLLKEHQLFDEYQQFLSPYLAPLLKEQIPGLISNHNFIALKSHLNFCPLLPTSKRIELQQPIDIFVNNQLKQLVTSKDPQFKSHFDWVYSTPLVLVLNQLDNSFYSTLIAYVDTAKLIVSKNKLSAQQLNKIKSTLLQINLTPKHQEQVVIFCQSESFHYKTTFLSSVIIWVKSPIFIIAIVVALFLIVLFNWNSNKAPNLQHTKTSSGIDSLTDNELDQVDSLFGFKTDSMIQDGDNIQSSAPPEYILTADLNTIKNKKAKALYSSFILDYQIQKENGLYGNCTTTKKSLFQASLYSGVESFSAIPSTNHTIKNESDEEVYVLVFEPYKNGKIYGALIAPERSIKIYLKKEESVIFYSGQQMNQFNTMKSENNGYGTIDDAKRVNKGFDYHFCLQDIYNFQQLNRIYKVVSIKGITVFKALSNGGYIVKSNAIEVE